MINLAIGYVYVNLSLITFFVAGALSTDRTMYRHKISLDQIKIDPNLE